MTEINKAKVLILATDGFEQSELEVPMKELRARGATVHVAAPAQTREAGEIRGWDKADWGRAVPVDKTLDQVDCAAYDALVLPGGVINPDKLRIEPKAIEAIKRFVNDGKIVAAICHGPWLLAEAGAAAGRQMTSYKSIRTDMENAGAEWVDKEVVTDEGIITSRSPKDLPAFVAKIVEEIGEGRHQRAA
jgi:protease I